MKSGESSLRIMMVLCVITFLMLPVQALAKDGWYMGMDLGVAMAPDVAVAGRDNDVGTLCDQVINPDAFNPDPSTPIDCTRDGSEGDTWTNPFDGGTGILAGFSLGYRLGSFRGEGEYFYRATTHDSRSTTRGLAPSIQRKVGEELEVLDGGVDDVLSHNFFANLYYDINTNSRFTPYVGVGVGVARVSLDYFSRWKRHANPEKITTFNDRNSQNLPCQQIPSDMGLCQTLAGTTTIADRKLTDTLFGYQILAGVDYRISDPVSIGLKFRWADFGEFKDEAEWDQLRSHDSHNGDGVRVRYKATTDDIQFWGLSLNMKYAF